MRSLRSVLLDKLVARRPQQAFRQAAAALGLTAFCLRVRADSPLYRAGGGETIELPFDDVIMPFVLENARWQTEELDFIAAHLGADPAVLIDVGANVGLVTRQLMHRLPQLAAAVCFEPHPGNFRMLEHNLRHLPQCRLVPVAIGPQQGVLRFYEELGNAGNYSLNEDAMRGKRFSVSEVQCLLATEAQLMAPLTPAQRLLPLVWKSDTQGFDETIMSALPDSFWQRVQAGVMELWRIERPAFDRERFAQLLESFPVRCFGHDPQRPLSVAQIMDFAAGSDYRHADLFFART